MRMARDCAGARLTGAWPDDARGWHRIGGVEDAFLRFLGIDDPQARRDMVEQILLEAMRTAPARPERRCAPTRGDAGPHPRVLALSPDPGRRGLIVAIAAPAHEERDEP